MKKLLPLIFLFLTFNLFAQQEANFWYFGRNAALDFSSGTPQPVSGSQLNTTEGCSSFSDSSGNLLFYSDGTTVWDKNDDVMNFTNGTPASNLRGNSSSTQSGMIIPKPGSTTEYYLFTVGSNVGGGLSGFNYYTIDFSTNPLGEITDTTANGVDLSGALGLSGSWTEKVTAVRGSNCNEYWVISSSTSNTSNDNRGAFFAYRITATGVDTVNYQESIINNYFIDGDVRGSLKVSPDGTTLVAANMSRGTFIFDFDDTTGVVSNYKSATNPEQLTLNKTGVNTSNQGYGVEFSTSSKRLYITTGEFNSAIEGLFQFDLTLPTFSDINSDANKYLIHSYNNTRNAIQLAPDNKIYWASENSQNISVINNPEELGAAVNYSHQSVNLGGAISSQGLPPFISSLLLPIELTDSASNQVINNQTVQYCLLEDVLIQPEPVTAQTGTTIDYEWTFNDGTTTSVVSTTTDLTLNNIQFNNAGNYTLTVTLTDECGNPTILSGTFTVEVYNNLTPVAPTDINFCDVDGDGLHAFDFQTDITPTILNGQDPTIVEAVYYPTENDAINNIRPNRLANPFTPTAFYDGPIWVRVHNIIAPNACNEVYSFNLQITGEPVAQTPDDIIVCDGDGTDSVDNDSLFDNFILNTRDAQILGALSATQYTVSYHTSLADAQTSATTNAIDKNTNYQSGNDVVFVRVENVDNVNCNDTSQTFELIVNPLPTPVDVTILQCDDDADLVADVNLTLEQENISTNHSNETFEYFTTQAEAIAGTPVIANPIAYNASNGDQVWVRTITTENCYRITRIDIVISFAADVPYNRAFIQCDDFLDFDGNDTPGSNDDTDGISTFDFSEATTDILADPSLAGALNLDVKYFETIADRASEINEIPDISNHRNNNDPSYANLQTIYAKIINTVNNDCTGLAELTLQTTPVPVANDINPDNEYELCDDFVDGDGSNGVIQSFDLESQTAAILGSQDPLAYTVTYHESTADATSGANPLASPYTNITPNRQTIYVRVSGNGCYYDRYSFDIVVNSLPIANQLNMANTHEVCDNDDDGSATNGFVQNIDLETLTTTILGTQDPTNFTVTYHTSYALAQTGAIPITGMYSNATQGGDTVYVRIVNNTTTCVNDTFNFQVQVNAEPLANPDNLVSNLSECDNDADGDDANGFVQSFDLESQIPDILGDPTVQDEDDFNVTFHLTQADATAGSAPQSSPFTNTNVNQQTIFVRIENKATGCVNDDLTFDVIVNSLPDFVVTTPQIVCLNNPPLTLSIENPNDVYTYQWFDTNGNPLGTAITQDVTVGGDYSVTATTTNGTMCPRTRTITVNESNIATISDDDITIVDDSENNSITINDSNLGEGDYEFALVDENGFTIVNYQDEAFFDGLNGGIYTIHIRDKNGCGVTTHTVPVIEFPKFFTPNNDGVKDVWTIKGTNATFFPINTVVIFNRQGKIINQFNINAYGWDGYYKDKPMPSNNYWFKATLVDRNGITRTRSGYFSLIRR
ncbi:T9SS type B sorting domain-containing protein [Tenacibaculum aquimarinum]|uniref:T9SS type B sorting domain-containing protein n=2 Tax=Flavobacteriaceae TaxID=49546 RepID=UPI001F0AC75D|nr:T9SS type B sorting domain-containing protein [Tenacibaculum aquimarinum]MCH3885428.1 T9SS type B sorting domain-containing protein [Tenacibaculum aquimarinum]